MTDRRRNGLILGLVFLLMAGSAGVIAVKKTRLGLDLQGGVELVYQAKPTPQQPKVTQAAIDRALEIMRKRVDKLGVSEPEIQRSGRDQISVGLPAVKNEPEAEKQVGTVAQLFFYDWENNVLGPDDKANPSDLSITGGQSAGQAGTLDEYTAVTRAAKRPPIKDGNNTQGSQVYLVDAKTQSVLAGPEDTTKDILTGLSPRGRLFKSLKNGTAKNAKFVTVNQGTIVVKSVDTHVKGAPDRYYVMNDNPALSGTDIKDPKQDFDRGTGGTGGPIVTFKFSKKGAKAWEKVTKTLARRGQELNLPPKTADDARQHFAAVLDGQLITVPFIDFVRDPDGLPGDQSSIEGGFTIKEAQDLAELLQIGALPVKLKRISESQVSATLGKQSLHEALIAGLVGFAAVILFLLTFYRIAGVIAVAALGIYALYFFALIKLVPITMTLPGIAGLVLTIGVAADANIVIFERVKEEIRAGASVRRGIVAGYKKGLSSIVDANVVTLMTAFILFVLATAGVKGFAFTLGVGTIVSLFTAVLATQAILTSLGRSRLLASPSALGAGHAKRPITFDFMGASKWFFSMSGTILLIGALAIGDKGVNFGIDFESGTRIKTDFVKNANEQQVRNVLAGGTIKITDAKVQKVKEPALGKHVFQISSKQLQPDKVNNVKNALDARFGITKDKSSNNDNFSNSSIGPTFGQTVANSAIIAIIASLLVISAYIAVRFEWKYAVPVLIALMHDLLITAGVYSLTGREVTSSTVAALLTILGYSLYDTIIVFDRVRENVPRMPRAAFSQIVNRSMSEVIVRSLATAAVTGLLVLSLLIFGGETLRDFAFALLVGILSGAYSSVFIASPVLSHWKGREPVYRRRHERIAAELGAVPAYAEAGSDIAPAEVKRNRRRVTAPDDPTDVSRDEFEEMVADLHATAPSDPTRDLDVEEAAPGPAAKSPRTRTRSRARRATGDARPPSAGNGPAAGAGNGASDEKPKPKRPRNKRHGRNR
jgi:SecD/SecF fusion protein